MSPLRPPRLLESMLETMLPETSAAEAALGDLAEEFALRVPAKGRFRASLWYLRHSLTIGGAAVVAGLRSERGVGMMSMGADVRYAARALRRSVRGPLIDD